MKALLTGAGGFLGGAMAHRLQAEGVEVHSLSPRPLPRSGHHVLAMTDTQGQTRLLQELKPDLLVHMAGILFADQRSEVYAVNTQYAASLLQALEQCDLKDCRVLLTGTAAEYGSITPQDLPLKESLPARPYDDYGISKLAQTQLGLATARKGFKVVVARTFNMLGAGLPEHFAAAGFLKQLRAIQAGEADPVLRTGNLNSERDFLHVKDVVDCYWRLLQAEPWGELVNVCSGVPTRIADILHGLIEACGVEVKVEPDPARMRAVDIPVHYGSTEKFQKGVGYQAAFDLDSCLSDMVALD